MTPELIVALDVPDVQALQRCLDRLPAAVRFVKIGLELFIGDGPTTLALAGNGGRRVFLDLKLHDIPRTVANSVASAARHRAALLTVHASGGPAMLTAAAEAARDAGPERPRLLAVTTLTSLDQADLARVGVTRPLHRHTLDLAAMALECGIDGVVCSVHEAAAMRAELGPAPLIVTPGIRPAHAALQDQKRAATPADAVKAGATHLVVGRPILQADDPAAAAAAILAEMQAADSARRTAR